MLARGLQPWKPVRLEALPVPSEMDNLRRIIDPLRSPVKSLVHMAT
jgi:hypothetical protein